MKFVKLFIISAVVLFGIITAFSSLLPSKIRISRAIDITSSSATILAEIKNMKQWNNWNEYIKVLPGKELTSDSVYSAALSVSIVSSDSSSVTTNWHEKDKKSFPGVFNIMPGKSQSTVQWYFEFTVKWYPWEKFGSIVYDKELGPQMEKSLQNLKEMLEKAP